MKDDELNGSGSLTEDDPLVTADLPEDISMVELAARMDGTHEPGSEDEDEDDPPVASGKDDEPAAAKPATAAKPPKTDSAPTVVATDEPETTTATDDKSFVAHPIYGALKGTRKLLAQQKEETAARERDNQQLRDQLASLQEQAAKGTPAGARAVQNAADEAGMVDDHGDPIDVKFVDTAKMRGEFDDSLVDAIETLQGTVKSLTGTVQALNNRERKRTDTDRQVAKATIQDDIDLVPKLAEWQADDDQAMYEAAIAVNDVLLQSPAWKDRPRVERFNEVVKRLSGGSANQPAPQPTVNADRAVANAKRTAAGKATPVSHSDLPSGSPPAQSEIETLEGMGPVQIAEKMRNMTPDQADAFLSRLG